MWAELKRETDVARTQQLLESLRCGGGLSKGSPR